ncbi:hypothetical protein LUZ62_043828 [Rhynchospora pubera]|uniref:Uncharacterized protein n=1 Tax=Rhynchospora pubera TaxID=906938 RepID=A0AAV8FNP1_9POAL|nr:hypothetical protein LUZ62_043828 [Rhynchospora pubera]
MASTQGNTSSHQNTLFDELRWVIHIRHTLEEEMDDDTGIPVSIFNVPKQLQLTKPEAYMPQFIAIGPYHHWRPELFEMERYKLASAKRTQKLLHGVKLQQLVEQFVKLEQRIRAYYHRYLDFNSETLAWMMIVDASFLLEFLQIHTVDDEGKPLRRLSSRMSHLVDFAGRKSAHNLILRDSMMLENQIPLFLLKRIIDPQCTSSEEADKMLTNMLTGYMKELCPFKMMNNFPKIDPTGHSHLLDLLFSIIAPKYEDSIDENEEITEEPDDKATPSEPKCGNCDYVKQLLTAIWSSFSSLNSQAFQFIKQLILSRPAKFLVKVPWKLLTSLPGFSVLKQPIEYLFTSQDNGSSKKEDQSSSTNINKPPLVEEIMIPSVEELIDVGVKFSPTNGDLTTISFDVKTVTFYLPTICLDINTEVILRNLVAYEASAASGPLVFTRYTELMNGIIDSEEDVMVLRQRGIILNRMKSDREVANLWNSMSKSIRLTRVPFLDKTIEDVNKYYNSRWRVKTKKFMKKYVFGSWQFLTFLAAILLLILTTLQAFCSVYSCSRWFGVVEVQQQ